MSGSDGRPYRTLSHACEAGFVTDWRKLQAIRDGDDALVHGIVEDYVALVYTYARRAGLRPNEAEDAAHDFLADRVYDGGLLSTARRERGGLRAYLARCVRNHVRTIQRRRSPIVAGAMPESIDASVEPTNAELDRTFARRILDEAIERCRLRLTIGRRPEQWDVLELGLLRPVRRDEPRPTYERLSEMIGLRSAVEAEQLMRGARERLHRCVLEVLRETVSSDDDRDAVYAEIDETLGRFVTARLADPGQDDA